MIRHRYIPVTDEKKTGWLKVFTMNLEQIAGRFDISVAEIDQLKADTEMFEYAVTVAHIFRTESQGRNAFKKLLVREKSHAGREVNVPDLPSLLPPPSTVARTGIFQRVAKMAKRIKAHPNYTDSIGERLGIIGSQMVVDYDKLKPSIKLIKSGWNVIIKWKKGVADAIDIYVDRNNDNNWQLLTRDTIPHYVDKQPRHDGKDPVLWRYKAIYVVNDEQVGEFSPVQSVTLSNG